MDKATFLIEKLDQIVRREGNLERMSDSLVEIALYLEQREQMGDHTKLISRITKLILDEHTPYGIIATAFWSLGKCNEAASVISTAKCIVEKFSCIKDVFTARNALIALENHCDERENIRELNKLGYSGAIIDLLENSPQIWREDDELYHRILYKLKLVCPR